MTTRIGQFGSIVSQHLQNVSKRFQSVVDQKIKNTSNSIISWAKETFVIVASNGKETRSFEEKKAICQKDLLLFQTVTVAALVANLTFTTVGFGFCLARWPFTGSGFLLVNVPLSYGTYNFYRLFENARDVIQNPRNYVKITQGTEEQQKIDFEFERIFSQITRGTFCFEWAAHWVIDPIKTKLAKPEHSNS